MNRFSMMMAISCLLLVTGPGASVEAGQRVAPLVIGDTFLLDSKVLGEKRRINVYLPPGYNESAALRVPVLYMPDGGLAEDFLHIAGLVQISVTNGTMRPFLLVGIENTERRRDLTGPTENEDDKKIAPHVGGSTAFRNFIRNELMPEIRSRYRTTAETAIVGESLAGLFVVETFLLEPDLFDIYIAFDPSLWWNNEMLVKNAARQLRAHPGLARTLYFASSDEKGIVVTAKLLAETLKKNAPAGIHWHYESMPEEKHSTIYHPAALRAFREVLAKVPQTGSTFVFHTGEFWLNLHHFLYVLGRAENKERDASREAVSGAPADQERGFAKLSPKEQQIWREAVAAYAGGVSQKDLVFDAPLPALTIALAHADDAKSLSKLKLDPAIASTLERAAPIYRKAWWAQHHDANRIWQQSIQLLVDRHGAAVLAFIINAYKMEWPANGFPVHVSSYANWAGAYSTDGNLLVLSSLNPTTQGVYGLETIFHEGMHQWDDRVLEALQRQAKNLNRDVPNNLSHALVFFTAGEAVQRAVPGHVPYAEKFGVWRRGWDEMKVLVEEVWKPYLDGHGTRDEAFAELIRRLAINRARN